MKANIMRQRRAARGSVAIEAVICLMVLIIFLAVPLFLARYFWHYTVAQRAALDAALYLSKASKTDMKILGPTGEPGAAALARTIAMDEMSELNPGSPMLPPDVLCEYTVGASSTWLRCNGVLTPTSVKVSVLMPFSDPFFPDSTASVAGSGLMIFADVQLRYVGI
jgi:hypothetical protein